MNLLEQVQFDLKQSQQKGIRVQNRNFQTKFFRELNFQQNATKWRQRRLKQRKNLVNIKQIIYEKCMQQFLQELKTQNKQSDNQFSEIFYHGHTIKGKFKKKYLHGNTQIFYQNGTQFKGFFKNGKMRTGKFDFKNGYQYWGELEGKKFMGKGTLKCPDGKRITGIWNTHDIVGKAQIQYPSGDIYYGQVKNFKKHGQGYLFFKNGNKFIGNFIQGQMNGLGTYFDLNGNVIKGIWKHNQVIQIKKEHQQYQEQPQRLQQEKDGQKKQQIEQQKIKLQQMEKNSLKDIQIIKMFLSKNLEK